MPCNTRHTRPSGQSMLCSMVNPCAPWSIHAVHAPPVLHGQSMLFMLPLCSMVNPCCSCSPCAPWSIHAVDAPPVLHGQSMLFMLPLHTRPSGQSMLFMLPMSI
jgi:hypothetical protein